MGKDAFFALRIVGWMLAVIWASIVRWPYVAPAILLILWKAGQS